ncbi:hypothetical protein [Micromonospora yangpuensis]|uniref:hypothetical protein n=1 Tax=Micromonospora yangpuensis TaxID=683228 RepID=UPI000B85789C|nr:hypothetical protein [Micromonospora yangpuensis]GGM20396.1 hypothetical protein GCM10012279_43490 [Micromonospora yangpuensis]
MRARQSDRRAPVVRRVTGLLVIAVLGLTSGVGCGGPTAETGDRPARRGPTPTATVSTADEQVARKAALAAYAGYLAATRAASRNSDPHHPQLTRYLGDPLLTRVRVTIRETKERGAMRTGKIVSDPTVTSVDLISEPPTVEIQDCLDTTGYRLVYTRNNKVVPGSGGSRHLATATASRYPDGRWLIRAGEAHQDQPC